MRHLVVLNPAAHGGRTGTLRAELASAFAAKGLSATFEATQAPGASRQRLARLGPGEFDVVVVAGGDGTLFEVVNGLMALPAERRPALGVLPLGTGNAFARDLGLEPGDWRGALDPLAAGKRCRVDVGQVDGEDETFWFINMLGLGFVEDAAQLAKKLKWLGRSSYTLGALVRLLGMPSYELQLRLDGEPLAGDGAGSNASLFFLEVANSRFTGTRFLMAPDARVDDGVFDVVVVRRLPLLRALRLFPTIYDGRHLDEPEVEVHRVATVEISPAAPVGGLLVDGEFHGRLPVRIQCLPAAIEVVGSVQPISPEQA
ncbi:MAG: YegS/Rv2252/BmrU family lipid kinase [Xanthomonadales bacterium]|jgi:diacylglycerol kinase (ATP)|nr:YegS/Rv2252/BmrU family lipid kinase [Xanthomonadales bacterium]